MVWSQRYSGTGESSEFAAQVSFPLNIAGAGTVEEGTNEAFTGKTDSGASERGWSVQIKLEAIWTG